MSYLFYLPTGIHITPASIFVKLADNFSEHGVMWMQCKTASIDVQGLWSAFEMALLRS